MAHSLFGPIKDLHPARKREARRLLGGWIKRTGQFASLGWSDDQICDFLEIDESMDLGFAQLAGQISDLKSRDRRPDLPY